ncbi:MAG: DUF6731 family protein [Pseudomonadota bacterium]
MAKVTVRFFKIEKAHQNAPDLDAALKAAFELGDKAADRERQVFDQTLRLERLSTDQTFYAGEVVKKQTDDIPPEANDNGLERLTLSEGGGVGHCIAFRYSVALRALAIQFDNRKVSVNRLLAYLREIDPTYDYRAEPIVRGDAWEKYNRGLPTKLELEIAQPQDLSVVEGKAASVIEATRNLADATNGPVISVTVKMGRRKGSLAKDTIDAILNHFSTGTGGSEDVRRLQVTASDEDGAEVINFLNDLLRESRDIDVPEGDPEGHYERRQRWLKTCFDAHFEYISKVYGSSQVV